MPDFPEERLQTMYDVISEAPPTSSELATTRKLEHFLSIECPKEDESGLKRREEMLRKLHVIFKQWVRDTCEEKGLPPEVVQSAGGVLFTSGSYRLGVHEKGADVDTICVAPKHCTREDFFSSLKLVLLEQAEVENLLAVETAFVPIMTFDFNQINLDLLFVSLPQETVGDDLDINDDNILKGLDPAAEKSLNGPRVTNMIFSLVPNWEAFLLVLRAVRLWAKRKGLYSNKMGYLGGVNYNILVAFIVQLYPTASASKVLERFFYILGLHWQWPKPVALNKPFDAGMGLEVWVPHGPNRSHAMPILTPAYPSMNSAANVGRQSLQVMKEELKDAFQAASRILQSGGEHWDQLFAPTDFFAAHNHYVGVEIYVTSEGSTDFQGWCSFVESRLRKFVEQLGSPMYPLTRLRLLPSKFPLVSKDLGDVGEGVTFFVAFDVDKNRHSSNQPLPINTAIENFKQWDLRYRGQTNAMKIKFNIFTFKTLMESVPSHVLSKYGGHDGLRQMRRNKRKQPPSHATTTPPPPQQQHHLKAQAGRLPSPGGIRGSSEGGSGGGGMAPPSGPNQRHSTGGGASCNGINVEPATLHPAALMQLKTEVSPIASTPPTGSEELQHLSPQALQRVPSLHNQQEEEYVRSLNTLSHSNNSFAKKPKKMKINLN